MESNTIVIIDDEKDILDLYVDILADISQSKVIFFDAFEALEYIEKNNKNITLVISDFKMPEINGLEVRRRMLEKDLNIPFLMVTGFYNKEMALEGMELKVSRFIDKPFSADDLVSIVQGEIDTYNKTINEEREMIRSFVEESSPMLEEIEELILVLEDDPTNVNSLNTYFRLLHTIKGTSSCVGLRSLPEFTHKYEDLVGDVKSGKIAVNSSVINIFLKGLDVLKKMYTSIKDGVCFEFDIEEELKIFSEPTMSDDSIIQTEDHDQATIKIDDHQQTDNKKDNKDNEKINVHVSMLDTFMELSGEMTVLRNMVLKSVSKIGSKYQNDKDIDVLSDTLDEMYKVSSSLQGQISELRKISMESVYRPLRRIVRDASKKLKKEVDLSFEGEELKVDTSIAKVLNNVLIHLLRNGIDHGIEMPDTRLMRGKNAEGKVVVSTKVDGENIIVNIADDGNGLDIDRIKKKAIENNLYKLEDIEKMSDQKIFSLIFESGFSTAAVVTDISGRGVGMDMVKSSVESINGKIMIDSSLGKGSSFSLILPIPRSVLIIKSLMVKIGSNQYSIALHDINEVISLEDQKIASEIRIIDDQKVICHNDEIIPLISLASRFGCTNHTDSSIIIIKNEDYKFGLFVDEVFDIEEVVVKKLSGHIANSDCLFLGATFIGDGEIALILNIEKIAKTYNISQILDEKVAINNSKQIVEEYLEFSAFDAHSRFAVELSKVHRLEDFESSLVTYSGDRAVVRYGESFLPLINFAEVIGNESTYYDTFQVVVVKNEHKYFGIVVEEIGEITQSYESMDDLFASDGIKGTVYINNETVSVVDLDVVLKSRTTVNLSTIETNDVYDDFDYIKAA